MNKISTNYHELAPAYGRDYKSAKDVEEAFRSGKDFEGDYILGFKPVSINDFLPGTTQNLRYRKNTRVAVIKI